MFHIPKVSAKYLFIYTFKKNSNILTYDSDEIQHAVSLSRPKIIFSESEHRQRMEHIQSANPFIKNVFIFGDEFDRLVNQFDSSFTAVEFVCEKQCIEDNVAFIMCSSGTTGLPKGVQLTQKNVMVSMEQHALVVKI